MTRATLSIHPLPKATIKQSFIFPSIEVAVGVVRQILRAEARPAVIRIFDEAESERYFPKIGRRVTTIFISEGEIEFTKLDAKIIRRISSENEG